MRMIQLTQSSKNKQNSRWLRRAILSIVSLLLCSEVFADEARMYLGAGLLDKGRTISFSIVDKNYLYGYLHKIRDYQDEYYTSDSAHLAYKVNETDKYSLFAGAALGVEQHDQSLYFAKNYATFRPRLSLWKRYSDMLAIGADLELGKAFTVYQKREGVDAPMKSYEPRPEVSIGINLKLN